ncbi:SDR family oxidoreductase [Vibrio navarrensis]|nr:SDR family oxidoreductase [Vibrio navarrensis]
MKIEDSHILLTGASGGIGRSIAKLLAEKGARLTLVGRDGDKLNALRQSLANAEKHKLICADLSSAEGIAQIRRAALQFIQQGERIDALINNAGCNQFRLLAKRSAESIESEIALNLLTPIHLTQSALTWLNKPGIILNIGSTFGSIGYPGYATYCAAKSGLLRFSEAMSRELEGTGIKVLYLAPRATNTELNSEAVKQLNQALGNHCDEPEVVAQHVLTTLEREHNMRWIGWPERLFVRINQILPFLVSGAIRKQQSVILSFLNR